VGRFLKASRIAGVLAAVDAGRVDSEILDREAQPTGGLGGAHQLKDEIGD
jgi:hypothetical protein